MLKKIKYLVSILLLGSCNQTIVDKGNYSEDTTICKTDGTPKDSLSYYYPATIRKASKNIKTELDTFMLDWFSSALYSAQEPILYNFYLGHDIYRFLWLRSFHKPVVFSLHKDKDQVWLITKMLDKQPDFIKVRRVKFLPPVLLQNGEIDTTKSYIEEVPVDSVSKPDRKATIILNNKRQLSEKEWNEFEKLLSDYGFWSAKPYMEGPGLDGSEWLIEAHLREKYWFVNRWSPDDKLKNVGLYLIQKSGTKEEIY